MHTKTIIYFDGNDPFPMGKRIAEAFHRVISFCPELLDKRRGDDRPVELTAHNRIVSGEFDVENMAAICVYADMVQDRILERYPAGQNDPLSESMHQAAKNLVDEVHRTALYVYERL